MKKNCLFFIFFLVIALFSVNKTFATETLAAFSDSESIVYSGTATICNGGGVKELRILSPKTGDKYKWFKDGVVIGPSAIGNKYTATTAAKYYVEVISGIDTVKSNEV
jgi:hypothetical protein